MWKLLPSILSLCKGPYSRSLQDLLGLRQMHLKKVLSLRYKIKVKKLSLKFLNIHRIIKHHKFLDSSVKMASRKIGFHATTTTSNTH